MLRLTTLALLLCTLAGVAAAESRVDITPSLAWFNPTKDVIDQDGITANYAPGLAYGARLSIWLNETVSLDVSGHYGRTTMDGNIMGEEGSLDMALFYGSAQLAVAMGKEQRLTLHGGVGMQGTNYDEFIEGSNIMTGVVGVSGVAPLGENTWLRADADLHLHTAYFELDGYQTDELTQNDWVLAVGIMFRSGGK